MKTPYLGGIVLTSNKMIGMFFFCVYSFRIIVMVIAQPSPRVSSISFVFVEFSIWSDMSFICFSVMLLFCSWYRLSTPECWHLPSGKKRSSSWFKNFKQLKYVSVEVKWWWTISRIDELSHHHFWESIFIPTSSVDSLLNFSVIVTVRRF